MKSIVRHIPTFYLFALLAGTLFFIPAILVSRFTTAPALWMQAGISVGIIGYVFLEKKRVHLPPKGYIPLIMIWVVYHAWQHQGNVERITSIIVLAAAFFLFHAILSCFKNVKPLFALLAFVALALSLWGLGQLLGLLPSYNGLFIVTGPFDNPAGISASLALLLPFLLYFCRWSEKRYRLLVIIATSLVVTVIVFSRARTAILAVVVVSIFFLIRLLKERGIKMRPLHYGVISVSFLLVLAGLFLMKRDSANGRLFIWQCSARLVSEKPVLGYGGNGFTANYMNEQASYFVKSPESKQVMLADNIRHPFNEFIKCAVNHGLVGLFLTLLLIIIPLSVSCKNSCPEQFIARLSLLSIGVCALFSYPFNYPFVRLVLVILLAFILAADSRQNFTTPNYFVKLNEQSQTCLSSAIARNSLTLVNGYLSKGIALLFSLVLLGTTAYQAYHQREWHRVAHRSLRGETDQMLPRYQSLYARLRYNDLFLYNYAAELNVAGGYDESMQIARECNALWADYDLQMLMADNCLQMQQYSEAESYLNKAAAMCPVKFMPLYRLTELYLETGQNEEARVLAQKIADKPVKIPSPVINSIKAKMTKLLIEPGIPD